MRSLRIVDCSRKKDMTCLPTVKTASILSFCCAAQHMSLRAPKVLVGLRGCQKGFVHGVFGIPQAHLLFVGPIAALSVPQDPSYENATHLKRQQQRQHVQ
jgi:hypothetical protein